MYDVDRSGETEIMRMRGSIGGDEVVAFRRVILLMSVERIEHRKESESEDRLTT
jgi:hypothetical protein